MNRLLPVALSLLALFATACPEENNNRGPDAAVGPDAAADAPDAESMAPDADAPGPDAGQIAPPLRTLLPPHLMGTAPIDNLVMAPNFDPMSEQWYAVTGGMDYADAQLVELPRTPVNGLPVLKILPMGANDRYLMGTARGGKAPLLASVWIGRDSTASPDLTMDFVVQGLTRTGPSEETFVLAPEPDSEQTIDRIRWVRYSARIDQDLLGFCSVLGYEASGQTVYFVGPALVQGVATQPFGKMRPAVKRRPTAGEAKVVHAFWEKMRRKAPPPRIKP